MRNMRKIIESDLQHSTYSKKSEIQTSRFRSPLDKSFKNISNLVRKKGYYDYDFGLQPRIKFVKLTYENIASSCVNK